MAGSGFDRMSARIFYHGTQYWSAYSIMRQGFQVGTETRGRNLGAGLYLTANAGFAAAWGPVVIRCRLTRGTRILWHTPVDIKVIKYLQKEFGAGITRPNFDKAIPHNKQLTRTEVAQLWNYLVQRHYLTTRPARRTYLPQLARHFPFIYKHLKRHGYDGVGIMHPEWPEMFLFNPSKAVPLSAHSYTSEGWSSTWIMDNLKLSGPLALEQLRDIQETALRALGREEKPRD